MTDHAASVAGHFRGTADCLLIEADEVGSPVDPDSLTRLTMGAVDHCRSVPAEMRAAVAAAVAAASTRLSERIAAGEDAGDVLVAETAALRAAAEQADRSPHEYDIVEMVRDVAAGVPVGTRGCVAGVYGGPGGGYEVELVDEDGRTIAVVTVSESDIRLVEDD